MLSLDRWPAWVRVALALVLAAAATLLVDDGSGWLQFAALVPALVLAASVIGSDRGDGASVFILLLMLAAIPIAMLVGRAAALGLLALLPLAAWWLLDRPSTQRPA
jgi:hypothetical protein